MQGGRTTCLVTRALCPILPFIQYLRIQPENGHIITNRKNLGVTFHNRVDLRNTIHDTSQAK